MFDVRCYIVYYILYIILYYYILLLYLILYSSFLFLFPSFLSFPFPFTLILIPIYLLPVSFCSSLLFSRSLPSPPNHSMNTCRYLHNLIYISDSSTILIYLQFCSSLPLISSSSSWSNHLLILYVSALTYSYLYSDTYTQSLNYKPTW